MDETPDGRRCAAGTCADHHPCGFGLGFQAHLCKQTLGDVVVPAPIGCALSEGELIHEVTAAFSGKSIAFWDHRPGISHLVASTAIEFDLVDLLLRCAGRDDCDEGQPEQARKVGFGDGGAARRRFNDGGAFANPSIAEPIEKK